MTDRRAKMNKTSLSTIQQLLAWTMSITTNENIVMRDELQDAMINQILDDMDTKTMMAILYDHMSESYDKYTVDELIEEVEEYYPHLLENN